jgi:sulfur relay (sulfurtransferase) DsrF/TusC family protein
MSLTRHFLDFSQPALSSAAEYLLQRYQRGAGADMANAIVVLPGRRAARRLLEILVEVSQQRGLLLSPPTLETVGQLPEQLYQAKRPFASGLTQQLAWASVLRDADGKHLQRVVAAPTAPDDVVGWLDLAQSVSQLHTELAADVLDFRDVARRGRELETFGEGERWAALRHLQEEYLKTLDTLQLWDVQTARLVAIAQRECQTDRDIVVLGAVDIPRTLRQMLEQVAERVTVLVHAPRAWADRFDDDGCLVPEVWATVSVPLDADRVRLVDGPAEVADMAARCLADLEGRYRADEITIGLADESIAPYVSRQLHDCGIAARTAVGTATSETAPYRLLAAFEAYFRSSRYGEFAALVRHPDLSAWIAKGEVAANWLERLDEYFRQHLQSRLSGDWLGDDARDRPVRQVYERVEVLRQYFQGSARPWPAWHDGLRQLLLEVYGDRVWDRERDRVSLDVFGQIRDALASVEAVPPALIPTIDAATAIQLTLRQLRSASVSSKFDPEAIELLGWPVSRWMSIRSIRPRRTIRSLPTCKTASVCSRCSPSVLSMLQPAAARSACLSANPSSRSRSCSNWTRTDASGYRPNWASAPRCSNSRKCWRISSGSVESRDDPRPNCRNTSWTNEPNMPPSSSSAATRMRSAF